MSEREARRQARQNGYYNNGYYNNNGYNNGCYQDTYGQWVCQNQYGYGSQYQY